LSFSELGQSVIQGSGVHCVRLQDKVIEHQQGQGEKQKYQDHAPAQFFLCRAFSPSGILGHDLPFFLGEDVHVGLYEAIVDLPVWIEHQSPAHIILQLELVPFEEAVAAQKGLINLLAGFGAFQFGAGHQFHKEIVAFLRDQLVFIRKGGIEDLPQQILV